MDALVRQHKYFKEHQQEFAEEHHGECVLIYKQKERGFFASYAGGMPIFEALKRKYIEGEFLISECIHPEEETPIIFHSRLA